MYCLSDAQTEFILNDIRRRGVEMEELQLNLLDHVCCIIEQNLKEGEDFEGFYQTIIKRFFKKELWEIEEETITLLTFKHYYAMKKTMIVSGALSVATFLAGSFFKIMHWQGASFFIFIAIASFTFIFLPLLFIIKNRETQGTRDKLIVAAAIFAGMLYSASSLFAIMRWPGRTPLWISTSAFSLFVLIPLYFFNGIRKPETKTNTIVTTILLAGATGLLFALTSLRPGRPIELFNFYANQDLAASEEFINRENKLAYVSLDTARINVNTELKQRAESLYKRIEILKVYLVNTIEGRNDNAVNYKSLSLKEASNYDRPTHLLFTDEGQANENLAGLKKETEAFNDFIKSTYHKDSFGMINTASTIDVQGDGQAIPWEIFNFYKSPFDIVLRNLTQMQLEVRIAERVCMK